MISQSTLTLLQGFMLVTDGCGILASWMLAMYYRGASSKYRIFTLYTFFLVLFVIFIALTISDAMVITKVHAGWATLPIVRGLMFRLMFRLPLAVAEFWMLHKLYSGTKNV